MKCNFFERESSDFKSYSSLFKASFFFPVATSELYDSDSHQMSYLELLSSCEFFVEYMLVCDMHLYIYYVLKIYVGNHRTDRFDVTGHHGSRQE